MQETPCLLPFLLSCAYLDATQTPPKAVSMCCFSVLAEWLAAGHNADIGSLMQDLTNPPMAQIGALSVNSFLKKRERSNLAAALSNLLASPTFRSCAKAPASTLRTVWPRRTAARRRSSRQRRLPPNPANPPTKRPLCRAHEASAGIRRGSRGRDAEPDVISITERSRMPGSGALDACRPTPIAREFSMGSRVQAKKAKDSEADLGGSVQRLAPRWFIIKNAHEALVGPILLHPRQTISLMRGPMTRGFCGRENGGHNWKASSCRQIAARDRPSSSKDHTEN